MFPRRLALGKLLVGAHRDVFMHREFGKRLGDLEGAHHALARDAVNRLAGDVPVQQFNVTRMHRHEARDTGEQRGLSGTVGADQRHDAALVHPQAGTVHGTQAAE